LLERQPTLLLVSHGNAVWQAVYHTLETTGCLGHRRAPLFIVGGKH
jgi:hypothetical protein